MYAGKQVPKIKTAQKVVLSLAFPALYEPGKTDGQYPKKLAKYSSVVPIKGRLKFDIHALNGVTVSKRMTCRMPDLASFFHSTRILTGKQQALWS